MENPENIIGSVGELSLLVVHLRSKMNSDLPSVRWVGSWWAWLRASSKHCHTPVRS